MNYEKIKYFFIIAFGYIIFTIVLTYPIAFNIKSLAGPPNDNLLFAWNMWWVKKAFMELHISPLATSYLFYPYNTSLAYHTLSLFNSAISIPLQYIFSLAVTYNIIWLSKFLFSAIGAYLLAYYFTKSRPASFISGLIYAFCPYHFVHAEGHLNLSTMEFIPLSILYIMKLHDSPRFRNALLGGVFLVLNFYSCYNHNVFLILFLLMLFVYRFFNDIANWNKGRKIINIKFAGYGAIMFVIYALGIMPLLYKFISEGWGKENVYGGHEDYVADLVGFFVPNQMHTLFKHFKWIDFIYSRFTGCLTEYVVFLGYTTLFLVFISIIKAKFRWKWFWISISLFFVILSFGPQLHILGKTYLGKLYLPYYWMIQNVPFLKQARCPSRVLVIAMLLFSLLAGYGVQYILEKIKSRRGKAAVFAAFCLVVSFEFLSIPIRQSAINIPKFYYDINKDGQDYVLLDFPIFMCDSFSETYMYFQTVHGKKIINGWISRLPPHLGKALDDVSRLSIKTLRKYNIKYVIVHKNFIDGPRNLDDRYRINLLEGDKQKYIYDLLQSEQRFKKVFEDTDIVVYDVTSTDIAESQEDAELLYIFSNAGGKFNIEECGEYIINAKVAVLPYLEKVEGEQIYKLDSEENVEKWTFNQSNVDYNYSIEGGKGLCLSTYFDGEGTEDEYIQMRNGGVDVDLKKYPYFYLVYRVQDPDAQTIEVVLGVDVNGDNVVDEYIRGGYPFPASKNTSRFVINFYDMIKEKMPAGANPKVKAIELYPHKIWGRDCASFGNRGEYEFWISKVGFYGNLLARGKNMICNIINIGTEDNWNVKYNPSEYILKKKGNFQVVSSCRPYIELSKNINSVDLQHHDYLLIECNVDELEGLESLEPILELDINGDGLGDAEISLGALFFNKGSNKYEINVREKISDNFPGLDKCFLTKIRLRIRTDEGSAREAEKIQFKRIKLFSKRFNNTGAFVFRKPCLELDSGIIWFYKEFDAEEAAGDILFAKKVFLKKGEHTIKNALGGGLKYIAIEKVIENGEK